MATIEPITYEYIEDETVKELLRLLGEMRELSNELYDVKHAIEAVNSNKKKNKLPR